MHVRRHRQRRSRVLALAGFLIIGWLCGCAGVAGLPRMGEIDLGKTYPSVQVFPNYEHFPECNFDFCAVLFSAGGAHLYMPKIESLGPGRPADFNLTFLRPYQVSDGSVLLAFPGSAPTEYTTPSGGIRIQFGFMPGEGIPRGPSLGTDFF